MKETAFPYLVLLHHGAKIISTTTMREMIAFNKQSQYRFPTVVASMHTSESAAERAAVRFYKRIKPEGWYLSQKGEIQ
jgi:hypothetical protein